MTLLERDKHAPGAWHGSLPVPSRYTYGLAGERFFRALKDDGELMGSYCPDCDHTYVPATVFCERCLGELTDWNDMGLEANCTPSRSCSLAMTASHWKSPKPWD